jgi:Fe2+ or Zn2+ uptake regulation protein
MSDFNAFQAERRRLLILHLLLRQPAYTASVVDIREALASQGHDVSQTKVQADLSWLAESDLVILQAQHTVASLAARGADVAEGRMEVPGVARPLPGEH